MLHISLILILNVDFYDFKGKKKIQWFLRGSYLPGVCQVLGEAIYINHLIQTSAQHNKTGITSPTLQMRPLDSEL